MHVLYGLFNQEFYTKLAPTIDATDMIDRMSTMILVENSRMEGGRSW